MTLSDYSGINTDFIDNATTNAGSGGPFTATTSGGNAGRHGDFITFCIEFNEHFSYGGYVQLRVIRRRQKRAV